MTTQSVGILVFDDAELLDFCGPYEVFSATNKVLQGNHYNVFLVGEKPEVRSFNGLVVKTDYDLDTAPPIDLLLVPGGFGTRKQMHNEDLMTWIKSRAPQTEKLLSVCTGSLMLAQGGLVNDLEITTHWAVFNELEKIHPPALVNRKKRVIDHGHVVVSAGVASGIDMAFSIVAQRFGEDAADKIAHYIEYRRVKDNTVEASK